jgi:hypothetical protein
MSYGVTIVNRMWITMWIKSLFVCKNNPVKILLYANECVLALNMIYYATTPAPVIV